MQAYSCHMCPVTVPKEPLGRQRVRTSGVASAVDGI